MITRRYTMPLMTRYTSLVSGGYAALLMCASAAPASFEAQRSAVAAAVETQPEAAILELLKAGTAENLPAPAASLAGEWLRRNLPKNSATLFHAARAAELSGETKNAVAYYQQALKLADPKSSEAGESITAVHTLLIYRLGDTASAYVFAQNEAERLSVNPSFRQFDSWFLSEAVKRNDPTALAKRLSAIIAAGVPADHLNVQFSNYFLWLLDAVDGYCDQPGKAPLSQDLYDTIKDLCEVMTHSEELKLRLDWAVSVKAYNLSRFGDQTKGKIGARGAGKKQPGKKPGKKSNEGAVLEEKKLEMGDDIAPPIPEASALLEKFPHYAMWVMSGWAGGGNGPHYRGDFKKYWPHEAEAKMAPILSALSKLPPAEAAEVLSAAANGGYVGSPGVSELKSVQDYLKATPALSNSRNGVVALDKEWNKFTPEEAQKLAPSLAQSSHPQASLVRAIATGGKDLDKVMEALLGPEVWRLGPTELNGVYADLLWHYCGRPGANTKRDDWINKSKALMATFAAADPKKEDPSDKRISAFRNLWADYKSPQPKIPAVRSRLAAVLKLTPEVVPELLKDFSPEAQSMVRDALAAGLDDAKGTLERDARVRGINLGSYSPWIQRLAGVNNDMARMKQDRKDLYAPHLLEPVLRVAVADRMAQGKIEPWLTMAWINLQFPENNAEPIKLMQALFKSPAWATVPFHVQFAARECFKKDAMTPGQAAILDASNPVLLCKELTTLPKEADVASTIAALTKTIDGLRKSPVFNEIQGLENVAAISDAAFADENLHMLFVGLIDMRLAIEPTPLFGNRIFATLTKRNDPADLLRSSAYLWRHVAVSHRTYPAMLTFAESALESNPSVSYAFANDGLGVIERHAGGHTWFKADTDIPRLKSIRGKAAMKLGLVVIPVAENHPNYPVYRSQVEWIAGNEDSAWNLVHSNWEAFTKLHRELTFSYLMWVLDRTTYSRDEAGQEFLIKSLLAWSGEKESPLTVTEKARVDIAYGDIALHRGQLREAHEIYSRIQKNPAFEGLPARHEAALRRVRAERMAKNFDAALQTLTDLEMQRIPEIWSEVRFARAETRYDMEEFEDAKEDIDSILDRDPNHADARLLLGKVQLRRKKLMEATEVEIGSAAGQSSLVPGENLKVTLSDPALAVSGAGTETEVVVWAVSGDRETFFLRQFGDEKTKFRGEIPTLLGAPAQGDGKLQVIGSDEVFYAYSEAFRRKMNLTDEKRGGPIMIGSDAVLMASARKLLTEAEQRVADMQELMDKIGTKGTVSSAAANAQWANRAIGGEVDESDKAKRIDAIAKPGNPLHVRVVDPDRSRTSGIDELTVAAIASSGDTVSSITLRETATHTGIFEGTIATKGAQAQALAENSEPGRSPNMVISPRMDYPAWKPVASKGAAAPAFTVDFNDNVPLGEMKITAREPGARLKQFSIQTGMNAADMTTVATYPKSLISIQNPWSPSVTIMNDSDRYHNNNSRSVYDFSEIEAHLDRGWMSQQFAAGVAENVAGPSAAMTASIPAKVKWLRQNQHHNSHVVYRFRGYFHELADVTRRFKVELGPYKVPANTHPSVADAPQFLLAVDGRPITSKEKLDLLEGEINLRSGVHRFEIWATGWDCTIGFGRTVKLMSNLAAPEALVECPDSFFDPSKFPSALVDHRNSPATIEAAGDGEFRVKFAKDSKARMFRLLVIGHEGPVPALNKISLTKPDGGIILPVASDFAELNKNDTLEMLTGDKIYVRYVDDRFVTKTKQRHERMLSVAFTDARIEFADMEPRFDSRHNEDRPYYEKLIRFAHDKPLTLAIHDADMDSTVNPDKVKVTIDTDAGPRAFDAVETGDSTGIFKLVITPVKGSATGNQVTVAAGGKITATYLDEENNRPGVAAKRVATIDHAAFVTPQIVLSHSTVTPLAAEAKTLPLITGFERLANADDKGGRASGESIQQRWAHQQTMLPAQKAPEGGFQAVLGQQVVVDVVAPHLALGVASNVDVYVQSDSSRRAAGATQGEFNIQAPGTVLLKGSLESYSRPSAFSDWHGVPILPIYQSTSSISAEDSTVMDRFRTTVPVILGVLPPYGALTDAEFYAMRKEAMSKLDAEAIPESISGVVVRPGDKLHFGFRFTDAAGATRWVTASSSVITHPVLDLMDADFRTPMTSAFVGETLNFRVVDTGADTSEAPDVVQVLIQAKSGAKKSIELHETGPHTGIFKAHHVLAYASATPAPSPAPPDASGEAQSVAPDDGLAVVYGDTVAARYTDSNGVKSQTCMVTISKGADGSIEPFSKQYDDPQIAMRTQFSLAEAHLELAKRHRKLNEKEAAALGFESAKQLLSKAMDQFTDPDTRAHAEYLLGNLTMEDADVTEEAELRETRYRAALSRFLNVTGSYPQTIHASKAQYQIATIYERLKEPDIAAQEYVKLAYKYPDSEYLAVSMARLGTHFLKKASDYEAKAKPLLETAKAEDNKDAGFEGEALMKMAVAEYLKTAKIFGRLQERFSNDALAGQAGLRAGQSFMRAGKNQDAINAFQRVISDEGYDGKTIRAQAMYWAGMCYQALKQPLAAYSVFKRLTYDFPESEWAAYARGQLSQEGMLDLETKLELERLEAEK